MPRFWLGGYSTELGGIADGVSELTAGGVDDALAGGSLRTGVLGVRAPSPSWIAAHPSLDVIYAALEGEGAVQAFRRVDAARLEPIGRPVSVGEAVCHVAVSPDGRMIVASCWGDGAVVSLPLSEHGRIGSAAHAEPAADPYSEKSMSATDASNVTDLGRAAAALRAAVGAEFADFVPFGDDSSGDPSRVDPVVAASTIDTDSTTRFSRAHQAVFLPDGTVATTDMGLDLVRFWRRSESRLVPGQQLVLPRGTGPRHMLLHPSGHLHVITELSGEIFTLTRAADGTWHILSATTLSRDRDDTDLAAEIALSHDASFLYGALRGSNSIATLRVDGGGSRLEPVALVDSGVDWPRHHLIARDTVLVAGQRSNSIASLTLDARTGIPGRVRHRADAPSPTCILPARV